jgi:hypothetical protein
VVVAYQVSLLEFACMDWGDAGKLSGTQTGFTKHIIWTFYLCTSTVKKKQNLELGINALIKYTLVCVQ